MSLRMITFFVIYVGKSEGAKKLIATPETQKTKQHIGCLFFLQNDSKRWSESQFARNGC